MGCPRVVFLDTNIFDSQRYNFLSNAFEPFLKAVSKDKFVLLLPDPTEQEINRHIEKKWREAYSALAQLERECPFVSKWKYWPPARARLLDKNLDDLIQDQWKNFLSHFTVERLGYLGIDLKEIMEWYHRGRGPFGPKKQKEFPDAIALAAILDFSKRGECSIAVVSQDSDFKRACEIYTELLYFRSLPAFTEAILSGDERLSDLKTALEANPEKIVEAITNEFGGHSFEYEEIPSVSVGDVHVNEVDITEFRIVALGDDECTIAFESKVNYSAWIEYEEEIEDYEGYSHTGKREGWVEDWTEISGTAKFRVLDSWTSLVEEVWVKFDHPTVYITESLREH
jgi:hypothetical protein